MNDLNIEPEALPATEDVPNEPIGAFHVTARDRKKASKVRKMLALDAPGDAGKYIKNVPIKVVPRIRKNQMFAVTTAGQRILEINLKSGEIRFVQ